MPFKKAPVSSSFLLVGMFGFAVSVLYWKAGKLSPPWGFTFALFSVMLFIAAMISLRQSIELEHGQSKARTTIKTSKKPAKKRSKKRKR